MKNEKVQRGKRKRKLSTKTANEATWKQPETNCPSCKYQTLALNCTKVSIKFHKARETRSIMSRALNKQGCGALRLRAFCFIPLILWHS